eukprot:gene22712-25729_t
MDSMLDEYMQDVLADPETYTETFDAFESDADSMLILGQPIDDQLKTKNISSFAIPKKKANGASHELYGEDFESDEGEEIDEYEYEESFESPEKSSSNRHDLKELSSITFGQSNSLSHEQPQVYNPPKEKKKKLKKKKRTASTTSSVLGVNSKANLPPHARGAQTQAGTNVSAVNSTTYPAVTGPSSLHKEKETPRGQNTTSHEQPSHAVSPRSVATRPSAPRVSTAGTNATNAGSTSGRKSQPVANNNAHAHNSNNPQSHQMQYHPPQQHPHDTPAESFGRNAHTPQVYPVHGAAAAGAAGHGAASVVSHANTSQSIAGRPHAHYTAGGAAFSAAMLQKQLDTALKQVAMYRKENEALQSHLDDAGINEAIERYKALLITKEHTIHQLESENNGLKSIARYQGKFLAEKAHQPTGLDSIQHHDKQIEIMLTHTRKLKEKVKKMEEHEKELMEQNEHLHTQNGRIQRKNAKLKRLLTKAGVNSGETTETVQQHQQDVLSELNHSTHVNNSPDRKKSVQEGDNASTHYPHNHSNQNGSVVESHGSHTLQESLHGHDQDQAKFLAPPPSIKQSIKKVVEEKEAIIHKQAMTIEALEKSLQTQRARFMREIDNYKAQLTEAEAEQKKLEAELEKRERFGRNQVSTLKQIRASYEELSTGYKKLLLASELYDRDTAPPVRKERSVESLPVVKEEVKPVPEQISQPRAAVISDEADGEETAYISPQ